MTTVFMDDFENNLTPYTVGEFGSPLNTVTIVNSPVHHGTKSCRFVWRSGNQGYVTKSFLNQTELYTRFLVRFGNLPAIGESLLFFEDEASLGFDITQVSLFNNGGILTWRMGYWNPTHLVANYVPVVAISANTWYELQVHSLIGNGNGISELYIDDTVRISQTSIRNTVYGASLHNFVLGTMMTGITPSAPVTFYADCLKIDTAKIATETVTPTQPVPPPIVYPTVTVDETTAQSSTTSAVVCNNEGARVRTLRHSTPISPWVAGS